MQNSKNFNIFLLIIYILITCTSIFFHEIWRDEAQAWCLARDLNFIDLYTQTRIEGHPFLWYLTLFPFTKMHLPVEAMQILSTILASLSVALLIFKSPVNKFIKCLIIFSAGMLYYIPSIARNYSLIPLLLFSCAYLYQKREEKPYLYLFSILLLSNTHIYMLGFSLISYFCYLYEIRRKINKKNIVPICILFLNFCFIGISLLHSMQENYVISEKINNTLNFADTFLLISNAFVYKICAISAFSRKYINIIGITLFYIPLIIYLYSLFKADKKIFLICSTGITYIFLAFLYVYFNGILYQKMFLILLILIFGLWNIKADKISKISFSILFISGLIIAPIVISEDIKYNFSGSKDIAKYIKANLNSENTFICVGNPYLFSGISAYLPDKKFYNIVTETYITYYTYNKTGNNLKSAYPENTSYSIVTDDIKIPDNDQLKMIYKSSKTNLSSKTQKEIFKIYNEIK